MSEKEMVKLQEDIAYTHFLYILLFYWSQDGSVVTQ